MTTFGYLHRWNVWYTSTNDGSLRHDHAPYGSPFDGMSSMAIMVYLFDGFIGINMIATYVFQGPRPGFFPDDKSQKKGRYHFWLVWRLSFFFVIVLFFYYCRKFLTHCLVLTKDMKHDNDWRCPKCGNVNFSFRTVCNMRKCGTPKPGSQVRLS